MDRRELLASAPAAVLGALGLADKPIDNSPKGVVTFFLNVGCMPSIKAEAFMERLLEKMRSQIRDDRWRLAVVGQRQKPSYIQVHALTEDKGEEVLREVMGRTYELKPPVASRAEVKAAVEGWFSNSACFLPNLSERIDELLDEAYRFEVNEPRRYVLERIEQDRDVLEAEISKCIRSSGAADNTPIRVYKA